MTKSIGMRKLMFGLFIFCLVGTTACNKKNKEATTTTIPSGIKFRSGSLENAVDLAKQQGKPIFLDFYTSWCVPCKWLEQDVLSHRNVWEYYNDNIVSLKVNGEKGEGPDLVLKYNVYGYPTLIYLDSNGNLLNRYEGMTSISNVVSMGERAVEENKAMICLPRDVDFSR